MKIESAQPERKLQTLEKEQAQTLLQEAREQPRETWVTLALLTGMRRGELIALQWHDIDLDARMLQVRQSARRVANQGVILSAPKSPASRRTIFLSRWLIEVLKRHRTHQDAMRQATGPALSEHDLVFCNSWGGSLNPESMSRDLRSLLRKAGLPPLRFHDLRVSTTALLFAVGVHPPVIQAILGHSALPTFSRLCVQPHLLLSLQREAMDMLSALVASGDEHENDSEEGTTLLRDVFL